MSEKPEWVSITAYALVHGVSRKTVYKWIDSGLLDIYRVGPRLIRVRCQPPKLLKSAKSHNRTASGM